MIYQKSDIQNLFEISNDTLEKLSLYHELLLKWQKAINLVSSNTINEAWHRHFIDSAQISSFIPESTKIYADLGCGGGFPGLVLAIMHPDIDTHLVESDERKGQFMRTVVRETGIVNAHVHTERIEDITSSFSPDFVTARALASLRNLLKYCLPWVEQNPDLQLCFLKGAKADEEITEARRYFNFDVESVQSLTDPAAKILRIEHYSTGKN